MELSTVLELSGLKTKKLCSSLRRSLGNEKVVESNIFKKMESLHDELDNYVDLRTLGIRQIEAYRPRPYSPHL